jgi:hypothetical protein
VYQSRDIPFILSILIIILSIKVWAGSDALVSPRGFFVGPLIRQFQTLLLLSLKNYYHYHYFLLFSIAQYSLLTISSLLVVSRTKEGVDSITSHHGQYK